jgi:hypothetical protein
MPIGVGARVWHVRSFRVHRVHFDLVRGIGIATFPGLRKGVSDFARANQSLAEPHSLRGSEVEGDLQLTIAGRRLKAPFAVLLADKCRRGKHICDRQEITAVADG